MFENGRGVIQNYEEAFKWCQEAANHGLEEAQCKLGNLYEEGRGVDRGVIEAVQWYQKAAEQGNADARSRLDLLLENDYNASE